MSLRGCIWMLLTLTLLFVIVSGCSDDDATPDGDTPDGDTPDGDTPDGDTPDGDTPDGDTPDGDTPDGDEPDGDNPDGDEDGDEDGPIPLQCVSPIAQRELPMVADDTFELGPYLMQATDTSIVVMWRTVDESDGTVLIGEGDEPDQTLSQEGVSNVHEIKVEGLSPNQRYAYRVRSNGTTSAMHHFYTAPGENQGFRFAVWGDNQHGPATFSTVVDGIAATKPHMLAGVGDHVQEGSLYSLWRDQLFEPARPLFHEVPFFPAIGNHEDYSQNIYDLYALPLWSDDAEEESVYSYTYGNAFFVVIDTNKAFFAIGDADTTLSAYIREQITSPAAQAATWRFAYAHEPGYAEAWGDGSCTYEGYQPVRGWLLPLLAENHFHAYFSGHMHGYERGTVEGGLTHIITGGGGGTLDAWCMDWPETKVAHYEHHFLNIEAGCDTLRIEATYPDGEVFDWLELSADSWGTVLDEGPVDDLPPPTVNSDSPSLDE